MKGIKKKLPVILMAVIGGAIGFFSARAGIHAATGMPASVAIANVILFIPGFFLMIAAHEAGHALAGVWVHFDFRMYVVGPFMWEKEVEGWKFKWNRNVNTSGGMVVCMPIDAQNIQNRFATYSLGGPIASLVTAAIMYGLHVLLSRVIDPSQGVQILMSWSWVLAFLSFVLFIATALPFHTGGFSSDGARVLRLLRGGDVAHFEVLLLKIISTSMAGVRPADWDRTELEQAAQLAKKINAQMGIYTHYFFYQNAFDRNELDQAEIHLKDYIEGQEAIPAGIRYGVSLEAAFFYALAKPDLEKALHFWNLFKPAALISKAQIYATEAAICLLKNEYQAALSKTESALVEIPNMMDRGIAILVEDKLQVMKELANIGIYQP